MTIKEEEKIVLGGGRLFRWCKNSKFGIIIVFASMKKMLKFLKKAPLSILH
jgi:hypothetical protein